eukprot:gene11210-54_t
MFHILQMLRMHEVPLEVQDDQSKDLTFTELVLWHSKMGYTWLFIILDITSKNTTTEKNMAKAVGHVDLVFKDQFVSRSDMWVIDSYLRSVDRAVYAGKRMSYEGVRFEMKDLLLEGQSKCDEGPICGLVGPGTKLTWRSRSCGLVFMLQLTRELYMHTDSGDLFLDRCIDGLVQDMVKRWQRAGATHLVYVVIFGRVMQYKKGKCGCTFNATMGSSCGLGSSGCNPNTPTPPLPAGTIGSPK